MDILLEIRNALHDTRALHHGERLMLLRRIVDRLDTMLNFATARRTSLEKEGIACVIRSTNHSIEPLSQANDELFERVLVEFEQLLARMIMINHEMTAGDSQVH
jgi:hypothetical protein